ncbi:MAG: ABC transporter permease [Clostridia bacterium]
MGKYAIKRIFSAIVTLFLIATITFFLMKLVPGGPFLAEKAPSAAVTAALEAKYGLDKPLNEQFFTYMADAMKGDFGPSIKQRGRNVADIIAKGFPVSAKIGGISILISMLIGIPLGCIAALWRGKSVDNTIIVFATFGISVPSFVVATILMMIFSTQLGWLPTYGLSSGLHYIMPVAALSFYPIAYISRLMRSSMLDVLGQDYMRTAKAKGLSGFVTLFKHALRNAVLPVVTFLGPMLAYTLTGSFVVERIFTVPGIGNEFVSSIINRDYPMIMGTTIFLATLLITMNVIVDIAYKVIDPRIKLN